MRALLAEGAILARIGGKLMECHAERLRGSRGQTHIRPGEQHPAAVIGSVGFQLLPKRVLQPDAHGRPLGQQLLGAPERQQARVECLGKLLQVRARPCCSSGERSNVEQHVPDPVLQLAEQDARAVRSLLQLRLRLQALDRRGEEVGVVLQERDVVLVELPTLP